MVKINQARRQHLQGLVGSLALGGLGMPRGASAHGAHRSEAGPASRAPAISAAVTPEGQIAVVGGTAPDQVFLQLYEPARGHWQPQRRVDLQGDGLAAGGQSRPKIACSPQGTLVLAWTRPGARPYTGDIRLMRSADVGASFSAPITVHHDRRPIGHRFEALAFDGAGALHVVWLDQRDALGPPPRRPGASMYRTISWDEGRHFAPEVRLAAGTCECCRIALARGQDGQLAVVWRHLFEGGVRDHAWAALGPLDAPAVLQRVSTDGGPLHACPHHGPSLAAAQAGGWHAVGWGGPLADPGVWYARLGPDGCPQRAAQRIPDPAAEHAVVAALGSEVVVVWRSFDGRATRLGIGHSRDDGARFVWRDAVLGTTDTDLPQCVVAGEQIYALCATEETIHVLPVL